MLSSRRSLSLGCAALVATASASLPGVASASLLTPDSSASSSASDIEVTVWVVSIIVTIVALAAVALLVRAVRTPGSDERRTRGTGGLQTRVAAALGLGAAALFVFGIVMTESVTSTEETGAEPITIDASAQQWLWRYEYPIPDDLETVGDDPPAPKPGIFSYYELVIPVDTPINLEVGSTDVLHNWWVPALSRQVDANPGEKKDTITFVADEEGLYEGRSTKFSAAAYPTMRTAVRVVSQDEFRGWLAEQAADIQDAAAAVQERIDNDNIPGLPGGEQQ